MKNFAKKSLVSVKKFVVAHKGAVAFATTVAVLVAMHRQGVSEYDSFLKDHDLYDEFHSVAA